VNSPHSVSLGWMMWNVHISTLIKLHKIVLQETRYTTMITRIIRLCVTVSNKHFKI
jgi:hypothetical protein